MLGAGGEVLQGWFAHRVGDRDQLSADDVLRPEFERAGAMVMGRGNYETAESAWGPHPPFENPIFVLTHPPREDDVRAGTTSKFVADGFNAAVERACAAAGGKDVMLHGGTAI